MSSPTEPLTQTERPQYDEYEESGVDWLGEIPAHWKKIRLKFLADFTGGGTPSKDNQEYWDGSNPWVSPKDMKAGRVTETQNYITPEAVTESSTKLVDPGSVLIVVRSGILKHTIPVATNEVEVALNQDLKAITPDDSLRSRYLAYLIEGRNDTLLLKWTKSGTTVESLEQRRISNTKIPVPPPDEQRAIAAYLDHETERIDALVEKKEQLINLLEEKRKSLISRVVTTGLDDKVGMKDSGVEWLGQTPSHWKVTRVQHVADIHPSSVDKKSDEEETPVKLCNYTDVYYGRRITDASEFMEATATVSEIETHKLQAGDVLVTKDSEARDDIAVPALVGRDMPGVLCGYHLAQLQSSSRINGEYLYYCFKTPSVSAQFEAAATGITRYGLGVHALKKSHLYLPPLDEQRAIAAHLNRETERIDTLVEKIQNSIEQLKEYRTALISAAVTGQIDVREVTGKSVSHQNS